MECLENYLFKNVELVETNGKIHKGYVDLYESALDDEDRHEEGIGIIPNKAAKGGIYLYRSEIESIKVIEE
jgi:hypothetical protein